MMKTFTAIAALLLCMIVIGVLGYSFSLLSPLIREVITIALVYLPTFASVVCVHVFIWKKTEDWAMRTIASLSLAFILMMGIYMMHNTIVLTILRKGGLQ